MFTEGPFWQEQRRFTLRHLRDLGFGKTSIEDMMLDEIHELLSEISTAAESDPDQIVNYKGIFSVSVLNVLWAMVVGERYRRNDPNPKKLLEAIETISRAGNVVRSVIPIPALLLRMFPKLRNFLGTRNDLFKELNNYFEVSKQHLPNLNCVLRPEEYISIAPVVPASTAP